MLIVAWIFMGIAILASALLLGDLKREMEYNYMNGSEKFALIITEGEYHGLQEADHRKSRVILPRCG
ncbi:MAG: hypothetical protein Q4F78_04010 [Bacillota bacterium]|nr:hypothetical protein [Bacillota bacterium]